MGVIFRATLVQGLVHREIIGENQPRLAKKMSASAILQAIGATIYATAIQRMVLPLKRPNKSKKFHYLPSMTMGRPLKIKVSALFNHLLTNWQAYRQTLSAVVPGKHKSSALQTRATVCVLH
jgi:hypothetical protein